MNRRTTMNLVLAISICISFVLGWWLGEKNLLRNTEKILAMAEQMSDSSAIRSEIGMLITIRNNEAGELIPLMEKIVSDRLKTMNDRNVLGEEFARYTEISRERVANYNSKFGTQLYVPEINRVNVD